MANGDPTGDEVLGSLSGLVCVIRQDPIVGDVERLLQFRGDPGQCGADLLG